MKSITTFFIESPCVTLFYLQKTAAFNNTNKKRVELPSKWGSWRYDAIFKRTVIQPFWTDPYIQCRQDRPRLRSTDINSVRNERMKDWFANGQGKKTKNSITKRDINSSHVVLKYLWLAFLLCIARTHLSAWGNTRSSFKCSKGSGGAFVRTRCTKLLLAKHWRTRSPLDCQLNC